MNELSTLPVGAVELDRHSSDIPRSVRRLASGEMGPFYLKYRRSHYAVSALNTYSNYIQESGVADKVDVYRAGRTVIFSKRWI